MAQRDSSIERPRQRERRERKEEEGGTGGGGRVARGGVRGKFNERQHPAGIRRRRRRQTTGAPRRLNFNPLITSFNRKLPGVLNS